jgi:hypothetical protein
MIWESDHEAAENAFDNLSSALFVFSLALSLNDGRSTVFETS